MTFYESDMALLAELRALVYALSDEPYQRHPMAARAIASAAERIVALKELDEAWIRATGCRTPAQFSESDTSEDDMGRPATAYRKDFGNAYAARLARGNQNERAALYPFNWGPVDGCHHKQWIIDQMLRLICGGAYEEFCREYEQEHGESWDEGVAP